MASEPTLPTRTYRAADHQQKEVSASTISMSAIAGNVTTTGGWINAYGYNQASILVSFTNAGTGDTSAAITFDVEVSNDADTSKTAYLLQSASVAAGTATLSTLTYSKASADASINYAVDFPINYGWFRIKSFAVSGGVATDSYTVAATLGNI